MNILRRHEKIHCMQIKQMRIFFGGHYLISTGNSLLIHIVTKFANDTNREACVFWLF
jgi:hypothetical protein